jgi:hypothetical protein
MATYNPSSQLYILSAYLSALSLGMAPFTTAYPSRAKSSRQSPYVVSVPLIFIASSPTAFNVTEFVLVVVEIMILYVQNELSSISVLWIA